MSEAIARQIEEQICTGTLQPGEMLPPENELVKEFGASRNTVREALRMVEASGLVKIKQGGRGGAVVSRMTNDFASDFLLKALRIGGLGPDTIHTFRLAIEPSIAEIVASKPHLDDSFFSRVEDNIAEARALHAAGQATVLTNMDFHVLLAEATENVLFVVVLKTLRDGLTAVAPTRDEQFRQETIDYHGKILDAIRERDPAKARRLMENHLTENRPAEDEGNGAESSRKTGGTNAFPGTGEERVGANHQNERRSKE